MIFKNVALKNLLEKQDIELKTKVVDKRETAKLERAFI